MRIRNVRSLTKQVMRRVGRVSDSVPLNEILKLVDIGRQRSVESHLPIVLSLTRPLPHEIDPLRFFKAAEAVDGIRNYWALPITHSWRVSIGEAAEIATNGPGRFRDASKAVRDLTRSSVTDDRTGYGLILTGGFRFNPGQPLDGSWKEFADGLLTLPRWMLACESTGQRLITVNLVVNADTDAASLKSELATEAIALFDAPVDFAEGSSMKVEDVADDFLLSLDNALAAIKDGRITKVTLARTMKATSENSVPVEAVLRNLASNYPECRVFAFCRGETCFIGASPEELASLQGQRVTSTCLAGSAPRGASNKEDLELSDWLLGDKKERQEHAVVVDWIAQRMGNLCSKLQWDDVPHVMRLGNLQHLATRFVGTPKKGCDVLTLTEALHPTPAVAGMPLESALEMIQQLEGFDRGWYTGPVGWVDRFGNGEFVIAIRCALLEGNEALLYAGDGIVAGSEPAREDRETMMKFKPLLTALGAS